MEQIFERYDKGFKFGYENPAESDYYEAIGRVNLYDLAVISNEDENAFQNFFNTLPMGIMEIRRRHGEFVRTNQSYRDFMKRFFGFDLRTRPGNIRRALRPRLDLHEAGAGTAARAAAAPSLTSRCRMGLSSMPLPGRSA